MKAVLFGGDRYSTIQILKIMLDKGTQVVACVMEAKFPNALSEICKQKDIPIYSDAEMYECLKWDSFPEFDVGISYLYNKILKAPIIDFSGEKIINFHPAPVEIHRGVAACSYCLLKEYIEWAVTAHYVTTGIDDGDVIMERRFSIEGLETAVDTEAFIQSQSVKLFEEVLGLLMEGDVLPRRKQKLSEGHYFSRKELDREKMISTEDNTDQIDKKIHALWLPPYHGACLEIQGKKYTLIDEKILKKVAELYRELRGSEIR